MISETCDDSNLFNGDGCSSSCQVESDFECEGGSLTSRDFCLPAPIPIKVSLLEDSSSILVEFNMDLEESLIEEGISIYAESNGKRQELDYLFSWNSASSFII